MIDSKAFAQSLSEERCDVLDFAKVERVLRQFGDVKGEDIGDLGISRLKIEEKSETYRGNLEDWVGPSNAIEGYVPKKDRISKPLGSKKSKQGMGLSFLHEGVLYFLVCAMLNLNCMHVEF